MAMALAAAALLTLFVVIVRVLVFNGVCSIVGRVPLPFAAAGRSVRHLCRRSDASFSSFEINK